MAKLLSERVWHSAKLSTVQPSEWRPEYAWLMPMAFVDGTFEADPRDIWARAYAYARPDWTPEKVALLLDEFERVGLLQRTTDEEGRVWGFWVGSDNFLPPPAHRERYKAGKRALFGNLKDVSTPAPVNIKDASLIPQGPVLDASKSLLSGVGSGGGFGRGIEKGEGVGSGAPNSENEMSPEHEEVLVRLNDERLKAEQVKGPVVSASSSLSNTVAPTPAPNPEDFTSRIEYAAACHKAGVLPVARRARRGSLTAAEYEAWKNEEELAKAMLADFGVVPDGNGGWKKPEAQ
jgi:hypothetical protein